MSADRLAGAPHQGPSKLQLLPQTLFGGKRTCSSGSLTSSLLSGTDAGFCDVLFLHLSRCSHMISLFILFICLLH